MIYNLIILFVILTFALGQVSFSGGIFPQGTFPDLLLVLSIFWVVYFGLERKIGWILLGGFFLDLASGGPLGWNIFLLAFIAYATSYVSFKLIMPGESGKFFLTMVFIFVGTVASEMISRALTLVMLKEGFDLTMLLGGEVFVKALFNVAFFMLIYLPLIKLEKIFFIQKEEIKF